MGRGTVCAVYVDASGTRGCGAALGDLFTQGEWPETELRGGINWKEL